ncbi:hypothetical protein BDF20DRAFT_833608 [Mycotypha africana]|uniref:uncharacterized protein n=1 Tax=Mycotypha africana TaxID=64632 RepID=UPI002300B3B5|nr:uncharacterized protein BDF20DRAFT_833608 [Mycotypha africana]KAI8984072.1 hypothetical protein BDF20DRAFT_833608 [Mycotypha africana]
MGSMSDSDEEYGPLPTTWGSQAPTSPAKESGNDPSPKGWDSLLDPDFNVGPKGLGSGNLHRKGRNFIPVDEDVILAQRLNKPLPKKSKKKGNERESNTSAITSDKARNSKKSSLKTSTTTSTPQSKRNGPSSSNSSFRRSSARKSKTASSPSSTSRPISNLSTSSKTTTSTKISPPELSTIRTPLQNNTNSTGWANATLVETPFWATTKTNGNNAETDTGQKATAEEDKISKQLNQLTIDYNDDKDKKEDNGTLSVNTYKKKTDEKWDNKFQAAVVEHKRKSIEQERKKNANANVENGSVDDDDWTFSDRMIDHDLSAQQKSKRDHMVNEDGWGIWNKTNSGSINNGGWGMPGWTDVPNSKTTGTSTAGMSTEPAPPAAADDWTIYPTTTNDNNDIPSDASRQNYIPNNKSSPSTTDLNHTTWGDMDNSWLNNHEDTANINNNCNDRPRFSDPTRQKYSEVRKGPRNTPLNYQRSIPIVPSTTAPPPPPENALLVTINVELSDTLKIPVEVHELDEPADLAVNVGKEHNIQQPKIIAALTKLFSSQKELALKKRNRKLKRTIPSQKQLHQNNPFFYQPHTENTAYQRMTLSTNNKYSSSAYASTFYDSNSLSLPAATPPLSTPYSFARPSTTSNFTRKQYY